MPPRGPYARGLATRQRVLEYYRAHRLPSPTIREVAAALDLSPHGVDYHRRALIKSGHLAHRGYSHQGTYAVDDVEAAS